MVEYLAIFKALERVKPFNDRVTIHTDLKGLKSVICNYFSSYKDKKRKRINPQDGSIFYMNSYKIGKLMWNKLNIFTKGGLQTILDDINKSFYI